MKKIFIILMAAMVAAGSVYAADNSKKTAKSKKAYNMSIGMVAGSGIGVQFKDMITDHFTIIEEFGYLGSFAAAGNGGRMSTIGVQWTTSSWLIRLSAPKGRVSVWIIL